MDNFIWDGSEFVDNTTLWCINQQGDANIGSIAVMNSNYYNYGLEKADLMASQDKSGPVNQDQDIVNVSSEDISWNDSVSGDSLIKRPIVVSNNNPLGTIKRGSSTCSIESIDCLISPTNSNTDTSRSVEVDDGISKIFSECRSLLNFGSGSAVSSGESEIEGGLSHSSNIDQGVNYAKLGEIVSKNCGTKRKYDQREIEFVANNTYHLGNVMEAEHSGSKSGFRLVSGNQHAQKKARTCKNRAVWSSNISFQQGIATGSGSSVTEEPDSEAIAQMKEMIYRAAAFRPVNFGPEVVEKPKRKNVRISSDPQTVAARQRRERIGERIRVLQRLVPGGSKMDTASMLDEAANYLKFLQSQVTALENLGHKMDSSNLLVSHNYLASYSQSFPVQTQFHIQNPYQNIH